MQKKRVLFLFRTYNDIDHITPIAWKARAQGWPTFFFFVDQDYSSDYRIQFLMSRGAVRVKTPFPGLAQLFLDAKESRNLFRRLTRSMVSFLFGGYLLLWYRIELVVTEWTGHFGRGLSELILRPAKLLRRRVVSVPHGYFLWRNSNFNQHIEKILGETGRFPDFSDRNWFGGYIVQSQEHKSENERYGMESSKITVLGSARFCSEWTSINDNLVPKIRPVERGESKFIVVFFLPHWDYQVEREKCVGLLRKLLEIDDLFLVIKAHTRGTGALSSEEKNELNKIGTLKFAEDDEHSSGLIRGADLVINFGSSIAFEALIHEIPVVNPRYLHRNGTFFDDSGATFDTFNESDTLRVISGILSRELPLKESDKISEFLRFRIDNGGKKEDVLPSYLKFFAGK